MQDMSVVEESWQTTRPTIRERSTFMFNNDLLSDVKFIVRGSNGESESKKVIPAHKFMLSISSPVFLAMFYGEIAETTDSIDLPDCEYEGLLELFRYMYSDKVKLSGSNVMQVLYLADKYMVPSLADKCIDCLQKNLDPSNVFCVLLHAQKYEVKNLVDLCWEVIETNTEEAVKSDGFAEIERSVLEAMVERDCLTAREVEVFKAVELWATHECKRQGLETDGTVKRKVLGERIVKGIRFPLMKPKEFASVVLDSKILTQEEVFDLIKYLNDALTSPVGFSETPRKMLICCRFCSAKGLWKCDGSNQHLSLFYLDKVRPVQRCRIVKYDVYYDYIERSYDGEEQDPMGKVLCGVKQSYMFDLLLETRLPSEVFSVYKPGGTTVKVHVVDLETEEIFLPVNVRAAVSSTVKDLKDLVSQKLGLASESLRLVFEGTYGDLKLLNNPKKVLKDLGFFKCNKVFAESSDLEEEKLLLFNDTKLFKVLDVYQHTTQISVMLPDPSRKPTELTNRYICETAVDSEKNERERGKIVHVDKRITLGKLKEILEDDVGCSREFFKVYRVYSNNQEIEYSKLSDSLTSFTNECKLRIKYGRVLKKGEYQLRVYLLSPAEKEPFKYLFDWIVNKGMSVKECKELLQPEICQRCGVDVPVENLRMRRKNWKNPGSVYVDTQVFEGDIAVYASFEVFLEVLEGPERMTSSKQLSIYVRHWQPSCLTLGPPREVVLGESTVEELKEEICKLSGIPVENVELSKGRGQFPYDVPLLEIQEDLDWASNVTSIGSSPLLISDDGAVVFFRDKTEELMEITDEKKKELMKKESAKLGRRSRKEDFVYNAKW